MSDVVQKLWGFCHTLRHDGIDYGDYIEQITYLLFLKMAEERGIDLRKLAVRRRDHVEKWDCSWPSLVARSGTDLLDGYADLLRALGQQKGKGVEPDVDVPLSPEGLRHGRDNQLEAAIATVEAMLGN